MDTPALSQWLALIECYCHEAHVAELLRRQGVALEKVQWIHGGGRVALPEAGIHLFLWKARAGKSAEVQVSGVAFELSGMRNGTSYAGDLPHDIRRGDSLEVIQGKLQPVTLTRGYGESTYEATFPDHRIVVQFKKDGQLRSCWWMSAKERRREPE